MAGPLCLDLTQPSLSQKRWFVRHQMLRIQELVRLKACCGLKIEKTALSGEQKGILMLAQDHISFSEKAKVCSTLSYELFRSFLKKIGIHSTFCANLYLLIKFSAFLFEQQLETNHEN